MKNATAVRWAQLEQHFAHHAALVNRFRSSGPAAVTRMWQTQRNEFGEHLSQLEREALIERHCELFGNWPS